MSSWPGRWRPNWSAGGLDQAFIAEHVLGAEAYLDARQMSLEKAARVCGLEAAQIRRLAEMYHTISPAVICPAMDPSAIRTAAVGCERIFALPALAGKFGVLGGGLLQGASASFPKTLARLQERISHHSCFHPQHRDHRPRSVGSAAQATHKGVVHL